MKKETGTSEQKQTDYRQISLKLISLADKGSDVSGYFSDISKVLLDFSGADRMHIVVNDIRNLYRFSFYPDKNPDIVSFEAFPPSSSDSDERMDKVLKEGGGLKELEGMVFTQSVNESAYMTVCGGILIADSGKPCLREKLSSLLVLPVKHEKDIIGTISLVWKNPGNIDKNDVPVYRYLFDIIGLARSHRQAKFNLGERIKELTTIYQITRLGAEIDKSLDDVLAGAADIIPPGFLHPQYACCRIVYSGQSFSSSNYETPVHTLRENICVGSENMGYIEVGYTRESGSLDKGPFLQEEQPMLMTIARELGLIAERKHFEDERERLHQQLLHADRLVTVGQLTAGVAHELNEPLGGILGFAQLIKKYGDISEGTEKDVDKIIKAALHAREIIRKLMLFSRQTPPEKSLLDINERIDDGLYLLESRLKKKRINLVKDLAKDLPRLRIDPSQFHQVLVNLVVNAIQAMNDGGSLTIKTEQTINSICMTVSDTGSGMSPEQIDKIFIPFYTTKGINEGTGLGLPVTLGIVQSHGGSISVSSEPGKGSAFIVKFPTDGDGNGN